MGTDSNAEIPMAKKALITGITGQDGSYLADFLLDKGYRVYGMIRRSSTETSERIDHIAVLIQTELPFHGVIAVTRAVPAGASPAALAADEVGE